MHLLPSFSLRLGFSVLLLSRLVVPSVAYQSIKVTRPFLELADGQITTVAGTIPFRGDNGPATSASLNSPGGVAVDGTGNLFIADSSNFRVRRVSAKTGIITTVAGSGEPKFSGDGGPAVNAGLDPHGVALDGAGNLFIADTSNNRIRRVDVKTGIITTVAGGGTGGLGDNGPAVEADLRLPFGVVVDGAGNLFIADTLDFRIRRVDATTGIITTVAGNDFGFSGDGGPAVEANLRLPFGIAVDGAGNLFIADTLNRRIRRVDASTRIITTVAGNGAGNFSGDGGPATSASLSGPESVAVDGAGNLFIADADSNRIRRVDASTRIITTVAGGGTGGLGDNGPAVSARLFSPGGVALDGAGNLFIADTGIDRIRRADASTGLITTVAGTSRFGFSGDGGPATIAILDGPEGVAVDGAGNLFVADAFNNRIRLVGAKTGIIITVAGNGNFGFSGDGGPATSASLNAPFGVTVDGAGNLFIADTFNRRIRRVDASTSMITTVAGGGTGGLGDNGPATSATLSSPQGLAVDGAGNLFIADSLSDRIRRVDAKTGIITTVAGSGSFGFSGDGGPATSASLSDPFGVAIDKAGDLFIADSSNGRIRRVDATTGVITTIAGGGTGALGDNGPATSATLSSPQSLAVDGAGDLFIADADSNRVRRVDAKTGVITTVAGNGLAGFSGDGGPAVSASLNGPVGIVIDRTDNLFIADIGNNIVRFVERISGGGPVSDFALVFNPATVNVSRGQRGQFTVNINRTGGFTGNVTVTAPDTKPFKIKLTPPKQSTTGTSVSFDFKIKKSAPTGMQPLVFTGQDDAGRMRTGTLTLIIQ